MVDLHVHSNCSDGSFSPSELVDLAIQKGLSAFALTDHDTVAGLEEAITYARIQNSDPDTPIECIPGIEFSTSYEGRDVHIVGLSIDYKNASFEKELQAFVNSREERNEKMCALLYSGAGIDISLGMLKETFGDAVLTRAHYGRFLLDHGYVKSMKEAFDRYIGDHAPYYIPREKVTPQQAIELIQEANGIPILAHPVLYHMSDARLERLVLELKEAGLKGIETYYSTYSASETRQMRSLALAHHLLESGGSDFHGNNKPGLELGIGYGKLNIPDQVWNTLSSELNK